MNMYIDTLVQLLQAIDYVAFLNVWLIGTNTVCVLLLIRERVKNVHLKTSLADSSISQAKKRSDALLDRAVRQSGDIVEEAEEEGLAIVGRSQELVSSVVKDYDKTLKTLETRFEEDLSLRLNQLTTQSEQTLAKALQVSESQLKGSFTTQMTAAQKAVEAYKIERMKRIDENMVEITLRALELVVGKQARLSGRENMIQEAFEQAKAEKII